MNNFVEVLQSFWNVHPILSAFILFFGFPEVEIILLVMLFILALAR